MADPLLPVVDIRREMAALRATSAPVVYFDIVGTAGAYNGIGNITLECGLHVIVDGRSLNEARVAAHLRFPVGSIRALRAALDHIEKALEPVPEMLKN